MENLTKNQIKHMAQTAVEWLVSELNQKIDFIPIDKLDMIRDIVQQAKQMEKEQIIETWHNGYHAPIPMIDEENCGQQYYNETYKTQAQ